MIDSIVLFFYKGGESSLRNQFMSKTMALFFLFLFNMCGYFPTVYGKTGAYYHSFTTPLLTYTKSITLTSPRSNVEGVDCIYVINLDDRPQKWARVKSLFDKRWLGVNRVSGINGRKLSTDTKKVLLGPYFPGINGGLGGGHIGCFLSHLSIMKDAYERGFDVVWVMEDDVEFLDDVDEVPRLLAELSKLDPCWDIFYTDTDSKDPQGNHIQSLMLAPRPDQPLSPLEWYLKRELLSPDIMKIGQRFGMYSVLISKRGLKKLIDYFSHVYLWSPIDIDIHYIPGIRQYSSTSDIVSHWSGNGFSDTLGSR